LERIHKSTFLRIGDEVLVKGPRAWSVGTVVLLNSNYKLATERGPLSRRQSFLKTFMMKYINRAPTRYSTVVNAEASKKLKHQHRPVLLAVWRTNDERYQNAKADLRLWGIPPEAKQYLTHRHYYRIFWFHIFYRNNKMKFYKLNESEITAHKI
jgi:hypothetical protein